MRPATLIVDMVSNGRTHGYDGPAEVRGEVRLVGPTADAAILGGQLGQRVLVLPVPSARPITFAERLLRMTAVVLELELEPGSVDLWTRPTDGQVDRIRLRTGRLEEILDAYELTPRVERFAFHGAALAVEITVTFRGLELVAVTFDADAERWLERFGVDPAQTPGGAE